MKITGTFLDEITHDIPSLNLDEAGWDREFALMKRIGITRAVMIRCGHKKWTTYPSKVLAERESAFIPPIDLVEIFLRCAEKHGIKFWFGTYFSGRDWLKDEYDINYESELMNAVCSEFFERYGKHSSAFGGWYLSQEISSAVSAKVVACYRLVGRHCKAISGNLPVLISPGFCHRKTNPRMGLSPAEHRRDWDWIFGEIRGAVDIVAFQDGHVECDELSAYLNPMKELADKHQLTLWSNVETFDRDIPGAMPPIKWEKLHVKLEAAVRAGISEAITFDFAHFLSPNSCYSQAGNLLKHYCGWADIPLPRKLERRGL